MYLGCSSFSWDTKDGKHLLGRTYDQFGNLEGNRIAFVPRNYKMGTKIGECSKSLITTPFSYVGMAVTGLHTPIIIDGLNEKGLMGALLHYPGYAVYDTQQSSDTTDIHPGFFLNYMLGQCSNTDQVSNLIPSINLTNEKIWNHDMPVHYIFSDTVRKTIIIEPDADGIHVYSQTIGVLTNSPNYHWHETNLGNYRGVTNLHKPIYPVESNYQLSYGNGSNGAFGLPGDYSSASRFIRIAILKHFAVKGKDELDGITRMFHNFASVDIPEGILQADHQPGYYEQTLCISAMCGESLTYYFSTASNRRISAVSLQQNLTNQELKYYDLQEHPDILYL